MFNLKDRDKSDHYNPFAYIHDTDDIVVVAKNLIKNMKEDPRQKNTADPIWEEGSTSLLEALLAYVYFEQPPEMHNMNSVMELFVLMQHRYGPQGRSQLDDIFEDLAMEKPASFAARQYGLYHMAPDKTAQSIDVSLGMRMSAFNIPSIMKICEDDTIHLEELASDKRWRCSLSHQTPPQPITFWQRSCSSNAFRFLCMLQTIVRITACLAMCGFS